MKTKTLHSLAYTKTVKFYSLGNTTRSDLPVGSATHKRSKVSPHKGLSLDPSSVLRQSPLGPSNSESGRSGCRGEGQVVGEGVG